VRTTRGCGRTGGYHRRATAAAPAHREADDPDDQQYGGDPPKGLQKPNPNPTRISRKRRIHRIIAGPPDRGKFLIPRDPGEAGRWNASPE
jgi:hypothetical protein